MDRAFEQFWGKARPRDDATSTWHPLVCHSLDVAAVAEALLRDWPGAATRIAEGCGWSTDAFVRAVVFLVALHDIGKFSRPFQAKAPEHWPSVLGERCDIGGPRHDAISLGLLWKDGIVALLEPIFPSWGTRLKPLLDAVAGHHGRPVARPPIDERHIVCAACLAAATDFTVAVVALLKPPSLPKPPKKETEVASWWLAGLTNLCDWIGSSITWFPYAGDDFETLENYWPLAQARARKAVSESGLLPAPPNARRGLLALMHDIKPTPIQALVETMPLPDGPLCVIIEDATGGGKTEAALVLAQRLIGEGRADGLFIALPTMATADAMFDRLARSYRRLFADDARPSLALAHGRAELNALFQGSILANAESADTTERSDGDDTGSAQCAAWLAEERRRVFFAHVGVGTIDQALLGVLTAKYAALRLLGLSRKVLVIDEAHAYDTYMSEEVDRLLAFHALLGGSSIVLSATLPRARRAALLAAFGKDLGATPYFPMKSEYPLVTVAGQAGGSERHAAMRAELPRDLPVRRLASASDAVSVLVEAARRGACGVWIRNTVDDARAGAEALRNAGIEPILFHARFAMGDRLTIQKCVLEWFGKKSGPTERAPGGIGRVLVATQVVEQSLDLDVDVMVTDLAPVELVIQRAGRLHRHPRPVRPPGFEAPALLVVSPEPVATPDGDWVRDAAIGGTRFVYPWHVLWRSARVLFATSLISVPDGVRAMVEAVYGEEAEDVPPALSAAQMEYVGKSIAARGQARANLLEPLRGYTYLNGQWESDTIMPTRLGDDYVTFRMMREEEGRLVPWYPDADPARAWALSEIALRRSIADAEAVPERFRPMLDRLRAGWTAWQRDISVLVLEPDETVGWASHVMHNGNKISVFYQSASGLSARHTPSVLPLMK